MAIASHGTPFSGNSRRLRADRILDATRRLLLQRGWRGVTMSEVAKLAGVGKGTPYLYWNTKEELIIELCLKDFLEGFDELIASLGASAKKIMPHELFPLIQRIMGKNPFITAIQAGDQELVGAIGNHPSIRRIIETAGRAKVFAEILPVLRAHRLLRDDLSLASQILATTAILSGFLLPLTDEVRSALSFSDHAEPDALFGSVCRMVLEESGPPDPDALAAAWTEGLRRLTAMRGRVAEVVDEIAINKRRSNNKNVLLNNNQSMSIDLVDDKARDG